MKNILNVTIASLLAASASIATAETVTYHYAVQVDDVHNVPGVVANSTVLVTVSAESDAPATYGDSQYGYAEWDGQASDISVKVFAGDTPIEFNAGPDSYMGSQLNDWPEDGAALSTYASNYEGYMVIDATFEGLEMPSTLDQYPDVRGYKVAGIEVPGQQNMFYMTLMGENDHSQIMGTVTRVMVDTGVAGPNQ